MTKPYLVVEWNDTETDAKGWLVIHNLVQGYAGGGTRMHPTVTREEVIRLAEAMGYKYVASESVTTGGCKAGIAYDYKAPDAPAVLRRFLLAMMPYIDKGVSLGNDLGTKYEDVLAVYQECGIDIPLTPAMQQDSMIEKGIKAYDALLTKQIDGLLMNDVVTGYGVAFAADEAWQYMHGKANAKVVIQGFGCVGASCALKLQALGYTIVGISDANTLVTCETGLDVQHLLDHKNEFGEMDPASFAESYTVHPNDTWLDVDCDILIPCALEDVIHKGNVQDVKARLVVEAANIPITSEADAILKQRGVRLVNDFVANVGSVRAYDVVIFGLVKAEPQAVIEDIERLCRKNVYRLLMAADKEQAYERDVAIEIFKPSKSDEIMYQVRTENKM